MNVIDFSEYSMKRQECEQEVQSAYQSMLAACANPEYVAQCLQEMRLVEQTQELIFRIRHDKNQ